MDETRREYLKRIDVVLDYIEANLDMDLSLECLSKKAHYSTYHFHRIFSTVVGERLSEFVNRKRIERIASILLVDHKIPLKELAYKYGFNSQNSFSRAFKKYFGISPTRFKSEGNKILSKIGIEAFSSEQYICSIAHIKQWIEMNAQITIKELAEIKVASISHIGDFGKIGHLYQRLMKWGHQKNVLDISNFKTITLYHDNPNVTQASQVRFSACVTIRESIKPDGEIRELALQKGIYAVGRFEISGEEIPKAWKSMNIWVLENEYEFRDGHYFEMYHNDHRTHPEQKFLLDICIPLEKTDNIKMDVTSSVNLLDAQEQNECSDNQLDYHQLISYMKELRAFFNKEYETYFKLGNIYKGNPEYSYFSLTPEELKKQKLKFVIILNHKMMSFSICLSGQNKSMRRKYWELFRESDWNKYHLVESIEDSLSIIDQTIVTEPDFANRGSLTEQIEAGSLEFISEITALLE